MRAARSVLPIAFFIFCWSGERWLLVKRAGSLTSFRSSPSGVPSRDEVPSAAPPAALTAVTLRSRQEASFAALPLHDRVVSRSHVIAWRDDLVARPVSGMTVRHRLAAPSPPCLSTSARAMRSPTTRSRASSARPSRAVKARRRRSAITRCSALWTRRTAFRSKASATGQCWPPSLSRTAARRALPAEGQGFQERAARRSAQEGLGQRRQDPLRAAASLPISPRPRGGLGHANIATTKIYDHREMRPENSPTVKVAYQWTVTFKQLDTNRERVDGSISIQHGELLPIHSLPPTSSEARWLTTSAIGLRQTTSAVLPPSSDMTGSIAPSMQRGAVGSPPEIPHIGTLYSPRGEDSADIKAEMPIVQLKGEIVQGEFGGWAARGGGALCGAGWSAHANASPSSKAQTIRALRRLRLGLSK